MAQDIEIKPLGDGIYTIVGLTRAGKNYLGDRTGRIGYHPLHELAVRAMEDGLSLVIRQEGREDAALRGDDGDQ